MIFFKLFDLSIVPFNTSLLHLSFMRESTYFFLFLLVLTRFATYNLEVVSKDFDISQIKGHCIF